MSLIDGQPRENLQNLNPFFT